MSKRPRSYPEPVERLIESFGQMPGTGTRTATRLALHVLKCSERDVRDFSAALIDVKERVSCCSICWQLTEVDPCPICSSPSRDASTVLVVEQPRDLIALEQTGMYRGTYHILMGRLSPLDGVEPEDLTISALLARIADPAKNAGGERVTEVILGLNPTLEGDGTAMFLHDQLAGRDISVSRLARGLPSGGSLELANKAVLADAIAGRQRM